MQLKRLNRRYLRLVQSGRSSGMGIVLAHNKFHEHIVKLGNNPRMLEIYTDLGQRCLRFRFMATAIIAIDDIRRDHDEIIAALEKGDGPGAEEAVRKNGIFIHNLEQWKKDAISAMIPDSNKEQIENEQTPPIKPVSKE